MSDILCIYYSRTGNTKKAMEEIASALDAELAELRDDADRSGWKGWLRCGLDAMRRSTRPVAPVETARPLGDYRLVILGTPVWAGRYSAVMRAFLKERGGEIQNAAYVLTRSSGAQYQEIYRQMDLSVPAGHRAGGVPCGAGTWAGNSGGRSSSVRSGLFWRDSRALLLEKLTGEVRPHAGKTERAGTAV